MGQIPFHVMATGVVPVHPRKQTDAYLDFSYMRTEPGEIPQESMALSQQ